MSIDPDQPELTAITDFLQRCAPFDTLPAPALARAAGRMDIAYHVRGETLEVDNADDGLRIIRQGAVELRGEQNQLLDLLAEGESFNLAGLNAEKEAVKACFIEDTLVYFLPRDDYKQLREANRSFDRFYHSQRSRRLRRAARYQPDPGLMMRPLHQLMSTHLLSVSSSTSLQETARLMSERRVSSTLVIDDGKLQGIVTDRDLRSRGLAEGLPLTTAIADVMTRQPACIAADATVFDATLMMTQQGYHHLPVMSDDRVAGIVTASDLMLARQDDPVYLVQHISRQQQVVGIKAVVASLPNLFVEWVSAGMRADQVSRILTAISDAVTQQLIKLAVRELGPAPVAFCWLGFGSQARGEQLLGADQDNGLLMANELQEADKPWFEQLAHFVCDGLNECGYDYCNGKVMATTDTWRQPLFGWQQTVDRWTRNPTSDAVMRVSIFFDLRCIYGEASLCDQLQYYMLEKAASNSIFLAALADNVLSSSPPLGMFRRFLVERNGEHKDSFNLKKRGVMPIIDMMRIRALANRITAVNTVDRIKALAQAKILTVADSRNIQDAFDFIMQLRIKNQAAQLLRGQGVDNYCNPDDLTELTKKQLRDTFTVVHEAQEFIRVNYRPGLR